MKFASTLPLSAISAISVISLLIHWGIIPPGLEILGYLQDSFSTYSFALIFLIILLESIVYIGFYFPGQFFAVVLVILAKPDLTDIVSLTVGMVGAATLGSALNYQFGKLSSNPQNNPAQTKTKHLLLAMIHMNSLAFFMFAQGANGRSFKVVLLAGLLNLPYYLALIAVTTFMSEEIMQVAESTWLVLSILMIWLLVALLIDFKKYRQAKLISP